MAYSPAVEQWRARLASIFPASEVDKMLYVIQGESGGRPEAVGDRGASYGLFQSQSPRGSIATPEQQIQDALRRFQQRGYKDWGENNSYQGKKFGALGNRPYPGGPSAASSGGGTSYNPSAGSSVTAGFDPAQVQALRDAVLGARNIQAPPSPLDASPEIANLYRSSFQLPQSEIATGALANIGEEQIKYQKDVEAKTQQLEQDMADFSKYKKVPKDNGGYDFIDPQGNQVDVATVSQRTGTRPTEIVKDSDNPEDQQYVSDYTRLNKFVQSMQDMETGDKEAAAYVKTTVDNDPGLKKLWSEHLAKNSSPDDFTQKIMDYFRQHYSKYYGLPRTPKTPVVSTRKIGPLRIPTGIGQPSSRRIFADPQTVLGNLPYNAYGFGGGSAQVPSQNARGSSILD